MSNLTLVVASYNHEHLIPRALKSVATQTERPALIVTDDASTDRSQEVIIQELHNHGLEAKTIFHQKNAGICKTFNEALALVKTPLVAFISADDWMEPTRVEEHARRLSGAPESVGLLYGDMVVDFADGSPSQPLQEFGWSRSLGMQGAVFHEVLREHLFPTPTVVMRTHAIRSVGGYDEKLKVEDFDMWLRLSRSFEVIYHPTPLVHYWRHSTNISNQFSGLNPSFLRDHMSAYSKHLDLGPEARDLILPQLYLDAIRLWKAGDQPRTMAGHIWREAVRTRSPKKALLTLAAALNLSPRLVFPAGAAQR